MNLPGEFCSAVLAAATPPAAGRGRIFLLGLLLAIALLSAGLARGRRGVVGVGLVALTATLLIAGWMVWTKNAGSNAP